MSLFKRPIRVFNFRNYGKCLRQIGCPESPNDNDKGEKTNKFPPEEPKEWAMETDGLNFYDCNNGNPPINPLPPKYPPHYMPMEYNCDPECDPCCEPPPDKNCEQPSVKEK